MSISDAVILIDPFDRMIGSADKLEVHRLGALHRAFSILIFNSRSQLLLQKRAMSKYHSRGLWSNTCCGHPRPGEMTEKAARRRLREEMALDCKLRKIFSFTYKADLEDGLVERELVHVFFGKSDDNPTLTPSEAEDWKWVDLATLIVDIRLRPNQFTYWFRICLDLINGQLGKRDLDRGFQSTFNEDQLFGLQGTLGAATAFRLF
jgi:isopentenyl-diphosphate delta-isomerase